MADFKFLTHEVLTHVPIGGLEPRSFSFNDPIWGGGQCELTVAINAGYDVSSLKNRTRPDGVELYVKDGDTYLWGGIINFRSRTPGIPLLTVQAQSWKSWFYTRLIPYQVVYTNVDQWVIARELMTFATSEVGTPDVYMTAANSGKNRDLTVQPFWSVGEALDNLGKRDGGFEWSIGFRNGSQTGLPELFLELWNHGQTRTGRALLFLDSAESTNYVTVGEIPEDATERRPRVWAQGETPDPNDIIVVKDEDPALPNETVLLRETMTQYSGVSRLPTLFDYARAERVARNAPFSVVSVDLRADQPRLSSYRSGDRARLRIKDEWEDIDIAGIRIIDRAVRKDENTDVTATVQLDMLDIDTTED